MTHPSVSRRTVGAWLAAAALALASSGAVLAQTPSGTPIRIGSTLALTGPLSATAQVHKIVGEI